VYNNYDTLNKYLLKSLDNQTADYELILVDNTQKKFNSASEALNHGGQRAKGEYIIFVHQDVDLLSEKFLENLEQILDKIPNFGIAGVAGKSKLNRFIISNIKQGKPPKYAAKIQITETVNVQTVDECFFVTPKTVFDRVTFDEKVCDGWHLYAVDYCLSVGEMNYAVCVVPISLYHRSVAGSFSRDYYSTIKKLIKKHEKNFDSIYTTMGNWNSYYPLSLQVLYQIIILYYTKFRQSTGRR
jgi:hypothetical protein